jgi:acetyl-CoA acetyltransferase
MSRESGRSTLSMAVEAIAAAAEDAGIKATDVDGLATFHVNDSASPHTVAATMGLPDVGWCHEELGGGSKAGAVIGDAAMALLAGSARYVAVYRSLNGRSGNRLGGSSGPAPIAMVDRQYETPYGLLSPAQNYALAASQHMARYGTRHEELGQIAVSQRANATLNDRALMRAPLSIEEYMDSRWIVEPFRLFDCCLETDGACAILMTTADRAADLRQAPSYLAGWASAVGPNGFSSGGGDLTTTAAAQVAPRLFARAGLGPADIDIAQLYDAFTFSVLVQLEDYGFCAKGEGGPFVASGATERTGSLPVNTHGGFLSEGYIHGLNHVCEAVQQLRGQAGARQVEGCAVALSSSQPGYLTGMSSAIVLHA